ncbi:glycoside hydrolase family 97 protein [Arachidicoccus sp.]|uniref:glycoside hydrolase family 97 protein n=1 Tax=Arachidicoccus sp. TaxID=1872624 RepID=UPI003D1C9B6B
MKSILLSLILIILVKGVFAQENAQRDFSLWSPNKILHLKITVGEKISYQLDYKTEKIIAPSSISMTLNETVIGRNCSIIKVKRQQVDKNIKPLYGQFSRLKDYYNELRIDFKNHYSLILRAYNEGVAYRFVTAFTDSVKVIDEQADFNLIGPLSAVVAQTDNYTAWELPYKDYHSINDIPANTHAIIPALFTHTSSKVNVVIAEADLLNYPGMYLQKAGNTIKGIWANYPSQTAMGSWGNFVRVVKQRAPFLAYTKGARTYPWRVIMVTDDDKSLLTNELVYKLSTPSKLTNVSWIRPGKATWEWWHDALLPGADIPSGMDNRNTTLYNYYVDFAAKNHLAYLMIDAGWSNVYDIQKPNPKIDIKAVIARAKSKHVDVFLWCVVSSLINHLDTNLDYIKSLGAVGLKIDFIDRNDQIAISWFQKIAAAAAKRHLMIDFHGCSEPTGLERTYPNILNFEAVRGAECDKWDTTASPNHHLDFIFTRMLAGPLDYTPGSMRNESRKAFKPIPKGLPSAQGTRCHELAMYVIFDQPLAMLCDAPTEYMKYPDIMRYLSVVPTTFDDTRVLAAKIGKYAMMAKREGKNWYVGAMTNWQSRSLNLSFSFLKPGVCYKAEIYTDGENANIEASQYNYKVVNVTSKTSMVLNLAEGGGAAIYIHP